ncbi:MAG: hypothetical protein C4575_09300 [Desulforudis sp.]|jgi:hypothetical protein|nr:MAG: hypothetical protein C4575_09300 [Desulforudis sp.]
MAKITGRVEILVNGQLLLNKEGAVLSGLGAGDGSYAVERETVIGDSGPHGIKEKVVPAKVEVTITDRDDVSLGALYRVNGNGTVIFRTANGGKVYVMDGATCMTPPSITAGEGEVKLTFESQSSGWYESTSLV